MAQRTGLWTIRQIGLRLCRYIALFTPTIAAAYPNNSALQAALAAANAACQVLVEEANEVLPEGV